MPGARRRSFRLGDRSELLIEQLLAGFAFTTRVPRQDDYGLDFFCSLVQQEGQMLKAGAFFAVQAKSTADPIVYEKPYELEWITNQQNPLLLCVGQREALAMDVYSTWNLLAGVHNGWRGQKRPVRIELVPGSGHHVWPWVSDENDGSQKIYLGKPVAHITDGDIFDEPRVEKLSTILEQWVTFDRTNIVNRHAHINWLLGPLIYDTNESPWASGQAGVAFYWHPANLRECAANLGRVATALKLILQNPQTDLDSSHSPWSARLSALDEALRTHWELLDDSVRNFLAGQGFKP